MGGTMNTAIDLLQIVLKYLRFIGEFAITGIAMIKFLIDRIANGAKPVQGTVV